MMEKAISRVLTAERSFELDMTFNKNLCDYVMRELA